MKEAIQPKGVAAPVAPYSPVVVSGDLVFLAGQVPFDEDANLVSEDFIDQARQVFTILSAAWRQWDADSKTSLR